MNTSTQEINMDNLTIVVAGLAVFIIVLLVAEVLAKFFDWR
jgi:preprotein translocase subunit Sec61beta